MRLDVGNIVELHQADNGWNRVRRYNGGQDVPTAGQTGKVVQVSDSFALVDITHGTDSGLTVVVDRFNDPRVTVKSKVYHHDSVLDITSEALRHYRIQWEWWLNSINATDTERELARTKMALIDAALQGVSA